MKNLLICMALSLLPIGWIQASEVDSLRNVLKSGTISDSNVLVDTYIKAGNAYSSLFEYDTSLLYYHKALDIAKNSNLSKKVIESLFQIGYNYYLKYEYPTALEYLQQAMYEAKSIDNDTTQAYLHDWISLQYLYSNALTEATEHQLTSISIREKLKDSLGLAENYFSMGEIFSAQSQYDKSLRYFELSSSYALQQNYKYLHAIASANISGMYLEKGRLDSAFIHAKECIKVSTAIGVESSLGYGHLMLADYFLKEQMLDSAMFYFTKVEKSSELMDDPGQHALALFGVGKVHHRQNLGVDAMPFYKEALSLSREVEMYDLEGEVATEMAEYFYQNNQFDSAFLFQKNLIAQQDSAYQEKSTSMVSVLETRFKIAQREREQEALLQRKNQQIRTLILFACVFGILVSLAFIWVLFRSFKMQKRNNELLAQRNQMIQDQNGKLTRYNEDLKQFAYATSHDLKQPLRTIGSFATLLERNLGAKVDPDSAEYFGYIRRAVNDMSSLLTNLLHYSQLDNKSLSYEYLEINEVMDSVTNNLAQLIREKDAEILIQYMPRLKANREHMLQLFQNLINNGLKFNTSRKPEIVVSVDQVQGYYRFSVRDNGLGIDKAFTDRIFGLFQRLNGPGEFSGSGMGLAISKKIIEHYKGEIWVDSKPGRGSTFYFTIPTTVERTLKKTG